MEERSVEMDVNKIYIKGIAGEDFKDNDTLQQYIELVNSQLIVDSLKMFEKLMPDYMNFER